MDSKKWPADKVERRKVSDLIPYARNSRLRSPQQVDQVAASIKEWGWTTPVLIDESGGIIAGHCRIMAAQKLGIEDVPCMVASGWTEAQKKAYVIADNRLAENATWDTEMLKLEFEELGDLKFDLNLTGFDADFIKGLTETIKGTEGLTDPDDVPENVETRCKPGDLWILGNHRLLCGDSTNVQHVERLMNGERADMCFTDPPYGIDVVGGDKAVGGGKIVKSNKYERVIGDMNPDVARDACALLISLNIKPMVIWGANNFAHALPESSAWLYWQKNQTGDFADGELAWTNAKGQIKRFEHTWAGLIKASEHGEKRCHPTQKPIALAEWCFEKYGPDTKSVLDLFLGSGSTLIACQKTGRRCFGMELDPGYASTVIARWEKFTGQQAQLET